MRKALFSWFVSFLALSSWVGRTTETHSIPGDTMELEETLRRSARVAARRSVSLSASEGPTGERATGEEGLGGPFAEVDGEGDAVAVVAGEDHHVFAARMAAEDGEHFFGEENRAAPAVDDAHVCKGRMQMADAGFEPAEAFGGFAFANIIASQIVCAVSSRAGTEWKAGRCANVRRDEAGAEDDAIRFEQTPPKIGKVYGVKRAARGEADGFELRGRKRGDGKRKGELRLG